MKDFILNLTKKQKIIAIVILILSWIVLFTIIYKNLYAEEDLEEEVILTNEINIVKENVAEDKKEEKVIVHVVGEVNEPGVVSLIEGSRIIDAINAAGGKTEEADLSKINLAYIVEDGTQIYIPRIGENMNETEFISGDAGKRCYIGKKFRGRRKYKCKS